LHNAALARLARACANQPDALDFNPKTKSAAKKDRNEPRVFDVARPPKKLSKR
jgi:hypothetical protein